MILKKALTFALEDEERGLKTHNVQMNDDAFEYFATQSQGDVRSALNALELAVLSDTETPLTLHLKMRKIAYNAEHF